MRPNGTLKHSVDSFGNHLEQRSDKVYGQMLRHKVKGTRCKEKSGVRRQNTIKTREKGKSTTNRRPRTTDHGQLTDDPISH